MSQMTGPSPTGELTPEQISEMRKQLEAKKKEIEEERKRIAARREQRLMKSDSHVSLTSLVSPTNSLPNSGATSPVSLSSSLRLSSTNECDTEKDQPIQKSTTSVTDDLIQLTPTASLSVTSIVTFKGSDNLTFKVEKAALDSKSDYIIDFSIVAISPGDYHHRTHQTLKTCEGEDKEISFRFNTLEDTVICVVKDMMMELSIQDKYEETIQNLMRHEVERLMKERETDKRNELLYRAETLESLKRFAEAQFCYKTLKELMDDLDDYSTSLIDIRQRIFLGLGHIDYKDKRLKEARNNYEQFLLLESRKTNVRGNSGIELEEGTTLAPNSNDTIPNKIRAFIGLAKVHAKEKNFKQAESILKGILLDQGDDEKTAEVIRTALVNVYEKQGKLYESETIYKRLYEERNHTYNTLETQAEKLMSVDSLPEAQVLFKQALDMKESALPILEKLAVLYVKHNKYKEAIESYGSCLEMKEKLRDPEHYSLSDTLCSMAKVLTYQSRWEEAEQHLVRSKKITEKALQSNENLLGCSTRSSGTDVGKIQARNTEIKKGLLVSLNGLIDLYNELQRPDEVNNLKKRLNEISAPSGQ
ncbi:TPR repeat-containing protein [Planoprotostelium fungivorum]|uniref:TPR repeat-containing protein n=1 Tax=Planoprotostelium fungivorum TaxID=1890364 RepID=A0A2P6NML7_9EUKA|nr:TPR repeat-containing protein [Planoprotostelium fungivorum]